METIKQHKLMQERDALLAENAEMEKELQAIIDKSKYDDDHYTFEDDERGEKISGKIITNARKIEAIERKLEMYEVFGDCFDKFYERLKAEYQIKPKKTVTIHGADLLEEFKRAEEAKKHEVKRKRP